MLCLQEEGKSLIANEFEMVTVLFTDLKGFTEFAGKLDPADLVAFLNIMYTQVCACFERAESA